MNRNTEKPILSPENLAELLYDEYCEKVGGVAFNGEKLPTWRDFSSDKSKQKQADAWIAVGRKVARMLGAA